MFEFSRSSSAEAERPEPFSQEGPALWSASLRSWDLCFEMDEQDRVIRVAGGRRIVCSAPMGLANSRGLSPSIWSGAPPVRRRWPACAGASVST